MASEPYLPNEILLKIASLNLDVAQKMSFACKGLRKYYLQERKKELKNYSLELAIRVNNRNLIHFGLRHGVFVDFDSLRLVIKGKRRKPLFLLMMKSLALRITSEDSDSCKAKLEVITLMNRLTVQPHFITIYGYNHHMDYLSESVSTDIKLSSHEGRELGQTLLHMACMKRKKFMIEALLENGADLEKRNCSGETPLMLCAHNKLFELVEFLLEKGANINNCHMRVGFGRNHNSRHLLVYAFDSVWRNRKNIVLLEIVLKYLSKNPVLLNLPQEEFDRLRLTYYVQENDTILQNPFDTYLINGKNILPLMSQFLSQIN